MDIPFNRPYLTGNELHYIADAHARGQLAGDGFYTRECSRWLEQAVGSHKALMTHSCTGALEMAAMLLAIRPGDQVIMPSYTFVSTANAFVLRGAVPVFVDIRRDTLNIDEQLIEAAINERTRAIVVVHYAGVACEMDVISSIANRHGLVVVEDAAQGLMSLYKGRPLGSIGNLGAVSFHETKNIISGEGGALLINTDSLAGRAEIIREKGTNRSRFLRGSVDKYTWVDLGSSYLPGEIICAFLYAQMEQAITITAARMEAWNRYHSALADLERAGLLRRPIIPAECRHNAHMYYILVSGDCNRDEVISSLRAQGVYCVFHYVPLHSSPAGRAFGQFPEELPVTDDVAGRLIRLPLWVGVAPHQTRIIAALQTVLRR